MGEVGDPPSTTTPPMERRAWRLWLPVWLIPLLEPALSLPRVDPMWPAAVGLAAFAASFLGLMWAGCGPLTSRDGVSEPFGRVALGTVTVLGIVLTVGYAAEPGGWLLVLAYAGIAGVATVPSPRGAIVWLVVTLVGLFAVGTFRELPIEETTSIALSTALAGAVVYMFRRLTLLVDHLRQTRTALAQSAVQTERLRFSRDLHDLLGHSLSLIVVKAEVAKRVAAEDPTGAARAAKDIEGIGRRALAEVREAVSGYSMRSFDAELGAARTALSEAGLEVTVRSDSEALSEPVDSLFGWVVREAATNVVRHSAAHRCEIAVHRRSGQVALEVRDDGLEVVAEPRRPGSGLAGLTERLDAVGGTLEAGRDGAGGWRVRAVVPEGVSHA